MAPASWSTEIAHPRIVRIVGRRSLVISIGIAPAEDESLSRQFVPEDLRPALTLLLLADAPGQQ
jgi:hypothetical protein